MLTTRLLVLLVEKDNEKLNIAMLQDKKVSSFLDLSLRFVECLFVSATSPFSQPVDAAIKCSRLACIVSDQYRP